MFVIRQEQIAQMMAAMEHSYYERLQQDAPNPDAKVQWFYKRAVQKVEKAQAAGWPHHHHG
jgi:hypothetical protein